jgi:hypothetical protein
MSVLAPTPPDRMTDASGRPYFLWDDDMSLDSFRANLRHPIRRFARTSSAS